MQIFDILKTQGRSIAWLARQTDYSANYLRQIKIGNRPPSPEFIRRASRAMQLPESVLFSPSELTAVSDSHIESSVHEHAGV